jgi:DNA-directed RNA polymerase subunit K/omega
MKSNKFLLTDPMENKYLAVLATAQRARQLLNRADRRGMQVDTEKVIGQCLEELGTGKLKYKVPVIEEPKND